MLTPNQIEESKKIDPETGVSPWDAAEWARNNMGGIFEPEIALDDPVQLGWAIGFMWGTRVLSDDVNRQCQTLRNWHARQRQT